MPSLENHWVGTNFKIFSAAFNLLLLSAFTFLGLGCANIVPPTGGPEDKTPPVLLSQNPKDSILNQMVYKITLHFNKYMEVHDLDKNLSTSPLLPVLPTVTAKGKSVVITLPDSSLKPNTTYRIAIGNALTDNREQNPYKNFTYIFSTGSFFDSLRLKGRVMDAETGMPDSTASIFLYPANIKDSGILKTRPEYVRKSHADGSFEFDGLPDRAFKIFAIADDDHNFNFNPETEKIDFYDTLVVPTIAPDTEIKFSIFKQELQKDTTQIKTEANRDHAAEVHNNRFNNNHHAAPPAKGAKLEHQPDYAVLVDTSTVLKGTFDITQPLVITLNKEIKSSDSNKIYLSYDDKGTEVEAIHQLKIDSGKMTIHPQQWQPDKIYTLRLIKGWAVDTAGQEIAPGKFIFRAQSLKDYATLNVRMDSARVGKQYLLILLSEGKEIWKGQVEKSLTNIPLLKAGDYSLRLVFDKNENGKWDPGNIFEKRHAEKVIPYSGTIHLKAGWTNDVDFKKSIDPASGKSEEADKKGRFSNQQPSHQQSTEPIKKEEK